MKAIYKGVADILLNDTDLKNMVGYTAKNMNIRRAYTPLGEWQKLVVFYLQPAYPVTDFEQRIRVSPLIVRVYDRDSDLSADDVAERIILLLDGGNLSVKDEVFVYDSAYIGDLISTGWNDELKSFERVLRFNLIYRVDAVAGSSGYPTRKRKQ